MSFGKKEISVSDLNKFDFKKCDLTFSSAGSKIASEFAPKITNSGCIIIDNSSYFRMDPGVPLIVPEVNSEDLQTIKKKIIANPNCSTIQLVVALAPIHKIARIKRINVATYQSVSGAGRQSVELLNQQNEVQKKL